MRPRAGLVSALTFLFSSSFTAHAQSDWKSCPVMATLPVKPAVTDPDGPRFEFRNCGNVIVNAYEAHKRAPTVILDLQEGYPPFPVHIHNVLVLRTIGGSAALWYVITFRSGRPIVALKEFDESWPAGESDREGCGHHGSVPG